MLFDKIELGQSLRSMRTQRGLGQSQLSEMIGVSRSSLCEWEAGLHFPPIEKLASILDCIGASDVERSEIAFLYDVPASLLVVGVDARTANRSVFGELIRGYRLANGLSQKQMALQLHVSSSTVSNWENGIKLPRSVSAQTLIDLLELGEEFSSESLTSLVRAVWKSQDKSEIMLLLPNLATSNERIDLVKSLVIFHAVRLQWASDGAWLTRLLISGRLHCELLMSANRVQELHLFSESLLAELGNVTGGSSDHEAIFIMNAVAQLRLRRGKSPLPKHMVIKFGRVSSVFQSEYLWGRLTFGNLLSSRELVQTLQTHILPDPCFQKETASGACFHLYANLLCEVGEYHQAARWLENGWDSYWKWADPRAPYMQFANIVAAKAFRLLGDKRQAHSHLKQASEALEKLEPSWRPGSLNHISEHFLREQHLLS